MELNHVVVEEEGMGMRMKVGAKQRKVKVGACLTCCYCWCYCFQERNIQSAGNVVDRTAGVGAEKKDEEEEAAGDVGGMYVVVEVVVSVEFGGVEVGDVEEADV
jgi:hypothetical protein